MQRDLTIHETKNYQQFIANHMQRTIKQYKLLIDSMKKNGFQYWNAIIVKRIAPKKFEIIDGHHRFEVAKRLNIPIFYIVCNNSEYSIIDANIIRKNFSTVNYMEAFVSDGRPEYKYLDEFTKNTKIGVCESVKILTGSLPCSGSNMLKFKRGEFEATNVDVGNKMAEIVSTINEFVSWGASRPSVLALYRLMALPKTKFDYKRLVQKIRTHNGLLRKQPDNDSFIQMYERIYNYHVSDNEKVPLYYWANQKPQNQNN